MPLVLESVMRTAEVDPMQSVVLRHAYKKGLVTAGVNGIGPDSTDAEILEYTRNQPTKLNSLRSARYWFVFIGESGDRARLWKVFENIGQPTVIGEHNVFDLQEIDEFTEFANRLVIRWSAPRAWWVKGATAVRYPIVEIADSEPVPFPGFDRLILDYPQLQAVMREQRYASWRVALASVIGIYLITDRSTGKQYVGKADGAENIAQRWTVYATNGHGGNVELRKLDPMHFRYSLLRVYGPATPTQEVDEAESHFKEALGTRQHGLNLN